MSKRGVGLLLILTAVSALGALAQDYRLDGLIATEQSAAINFDRRVRDLEHVVSSLDGSRRTALASGQTLADWLDRSATTIADTETTLTNQRTATSDAATIAALDSAAAALEKMKKA